MHTPSKIEQCHVTTTGVTDESLQGELRIIYFSTFYRVMITFNGYTCGFLLNIPIFTVFSTWSCYGTI